MLKLPISKISKIRRVEDHQVGHRCRRCRHEQNPWVRAQTRVKTWEYYGIIYVHITTRCSFLFGGCMYISVDPVTSRPSRLSGFQFIVEVCGMLFVFVMMVMMMMTMTIRTRLIRGMYVLHVCGYFGSRHDRSFLAKSRRGINGIPSSGFDDNNMSDLRRRSTRKIDFNPKIKESFLTCMKLRSYEVALFSPAPLTKSRCSVIPTSVSSRYAGYHYRGGYLSFSQSQGRAKGHATDAASGSRCMLSVYSFSLPLDDPCCCRHRPVRCHASFARRDRRIR